MKIKSLLMLSAAMVAGISGLPNSANAWDADGHRVVCEAAHILTDPAIGTFVDDILVADANADGCLWADKVAETEEYAWSRQNHFINVPADANSIDMTRDCPVEFISGEGGPRSCVVDAVNFYAHQIAATDVDNAQKAIALKFIGSLIADLHQPFNVGGALDRTVSVNGTETTLSALVDQAQPEGSASDWEGAVKQFATEIPVANLTAYANGKPVDWANESLQLARSLSEKAESMDDVLDDAALNNLRAEVNLQLAKAAVRLARTIEAAATRYQAAK